jgi:hypothetical protein
VKCNKYNLAQINGRKLNSKLIFIYAEVGDKTSV